MWNQHVAGADCIAQERGERGQKTEQIKPGATQRI